MDRRKAASIQWREIPGSLSGGENAPGARPRTAVFPSSVYRGILAHTEVDPSIECAGLLFGRKTSASEEGHPATLIAASQPILTASASASHFIMQADLWPSLWSKCLSTDGDPEMIGWYHSHPGHGVFLSGKDRATQAAWFQLPWHIALVVDPVRQEAAAFSGPEGFRSLLVIHPDAHRKDDPPAVF